MEVPESNNERIKLNKDKKFKPKTPPQIDENTYCKWITDKYNKKCEELDKVRTMLQASRREVRELRKAADSRRLKYMNDKQEFSRELMKDEEILKLNREIGNLHKAIIRIRKDNEKLIIENNKLKNN